MKNTSRISILLLAPFLVSFFGVLSVSLSYRQVGKDISSIEWNYKDNGEGFKVGGNGYQLRARAVSESGTALAYGNDLVWKVVNLDYDFNPHARIEEKNGSYYLYSLSNGPIKVTCSNQKGTVSRSFTAKCYSHGAVFVTPADAPSQQNISPETYLGEYDLQNGKKVKAQMKFIVSTMPADLVDKVTLFRSTDNIAWDNESKTLTVKEPGKATFILTDGGGADENASFTVNIVKDGVNVRTYDDLLNCTNRSEEGEIMVLQKNFGSLKETYSIGPDGTPRKKDNEYLKANSNTECFGNYANGGFDFSKDVYSFDTTGDSSFIDEWNRKTEEDKEFGSTHGKVSKKRYAALHVQKDVYGNGFALNFHNLCYPSGSTSLVDDQGVTHAFPTLGKDDLYRGPLPTFALGSIDTIPVIETYGQDNVGLYVDGNDITINDLKVQNASFGDRLENLENTGTVVEIHGDNDEVINSRITSGRTGIRVYSSKDFTLENSIVSYAYGFLLQIGSNELQPYDETAVRKFRNADGTMVEMNIRDYFKPNTDGHDINGERLLNNYITWPQSNYNQVQRWNYVKSDYGGLMMVQDALDGSETDYASTVNVKDVSFLTSGFASIGLMSSPCGPFLYNGIPSAVQRLLDEYAGGTSTILFPIKPEKILGNAYPSLLNLRGENHFYDYKRIRDYKVDAVVGQNIAKVAASIGFSEIGDYSDMISAAALLPLTGQIRTLARQNGALIRSGSEDECCLPVYLAGGGTNESKVNIIGDGDISPVAEASLAKSFVEAELPNNSPDQVFGIGQRFFTTIWGFGNEGYQFRLNGRDTSGSPQIDYFQERAKEKTENNE